MAASTPHIRHLISRRVAVGTGGLLTAVGIAGSSSDKARSSRNTVHTQMHRPVFRFGAIADIQYADVDDAWNFAKTNRRSYRGALVCLEAAVKDWLDGPRLDFIVDLGDIIDQQCEAKGDSHEALARVLQSFTPVSKDVPVYHMVGNHELYNFNRAECAKLIPNIFPWYHSFRPVHGWKIIVLDPYDLNVIEKGGGQAVDEGIEYLSQHNPNDLRAPRGTVDMIVGLSGLQRRFLPMGGALRHSQLHWLADELRSASEEHERVIICTHIPLHPEATVSGGLLWNYEDVLRTLRQAEDGVVVLVLAGHFHSGGYTVDAGTGTHHVTLQSPLQADPLDLRAHCSVEVWDDRVELHGQGIVPNRTMRFKALSELHEKRQSGPVSKDSFEPPAKL